MEVVGKDEKQENCIHKKPMYERMAGK